MDDDERFGTLLVQAVRTLDPPTDRLVAGGIARGRRRTRLIRGAEALTVLGVIGGVAALVVALLPSESSGRATIRPADSLPPVAPTTVPMTPQALLQTALDTLPRPGTTARYEGNLGDGGVNASFVYDDGHGAAQIDVGMAWGTPTKLQPHALEPITPCDAGIDGCRILADGTHVQIRQGQQYQDGRQPNTTEWSIDLVRADGVEVTIYEWNAPQPKDAALTRDKPPFTIDELITWAGSADWRLQISADRADASAQLFKAADLNPTPAQTRKLRERERAACRVAKASHKARPAYCVKIN
jgi:hypothetical protein